jgi:NitT/TauT family transport system substrate-binding protein
MEPLVAPSATGVQLKMFLARISKFGYVIGVPADSPIKTPADLKGKKIGVHSATGTSATFATESELSALGLKAADYELVTAGLNDQALDALASGKVAALGLPLYEMLPFIVAGTKLRIFRHPTLGDVPNSGYAAAPSVIAGKKDALRHFSRAIVKASAGSLQSCRGRARPAGCRRQTFQRRGRRAQDGGIDCVGRRSSCGGSG